MISCGTRAGQYDRRNVGRTYVATRPDDSQVLGYYTIASGSIAFEVIPMEWAKRFPRHPLPTVHLGRLAVDRQSQRQGLGEHLLLHGIKIALEVSRLIGICGVNVFALHDRASSSMFDTAFNHWPTIRCTCSFRSSPSNPWGFRAEREPIPCHGSPAEANAGGVLGGCCPDYSPSCNLLVPRLCQLCPDCRVSPASARLTQPWHKMNNPGWGPT